MLWLAACTPVLLSVSALRSPGGTGAAKKYTALTTASATAVFAGFELRESLFELGHHHGMALLALSKAAQATALASHAGKEAVEESTRRRTFLERCVTIRTMRWLFAFALLAALSEVVNDVRPGGHHGTALIALAELRDTTAGAVSDRRLGLLSRVVHNCWAKLLLSLGALVAASLELSREFLNYGAHHGTFILAASLVVKSAGEALGTHLHRPRRGLVDTPPTKKTDPLPTNEPPGEPRLA